MPLAVSCVTIASSFLSRDRSLAVDYRGSWDERLSS